MNQPAVSVIVPIYKADNTLLRCLDSLKAQTFQNFEVLMIDDGSPDRCGEIIDVYAEQDARFKAFHKENGGVSSARQFGIDHAQGEYTIHADPDDWVEPTMLEDLYRKAKEDDVDMVICDYYINTKGKDTYVNQRPTSLDCNRLLQELFIRLHGSCWNKLIRRNLFIEFNVTFPLGLSFCEDLYVICALLLNGCRVGYVRQAYYHYERNNNNSLSRRYSEKEAIQDEMLESLFEQLFREHQLYGFVHSKLRYLVVRRAFYGGAKMFSSKSFTSKFRDDFTCIKRGNEYSLERILLMCSIKGFYHPIIDILRCLLYIKARLKINS